MDAWAWIGRYRNNRTEDEILETAVEAVENLFIQAQGHCPTEQYEDGYSDAIADAVKAIRNLKNANDDNQ